MTAALLSLRLSTINILPSDVLRRLRSKDSVLVIAVLTSVIAVSDHLQSNDPADFWPRILTWIAAASMVVMFEVLFLWATSRAGSWRVPTVVIHAVTAVLVMSALTKAHSVLSLSHGILSDVFVWNAMAMFVGLCLAELGALMFFAIHPTASPKPDDSTSMKGPIKTKILTIGTHKIPVADLVHIKSEDHYCHVFHKNGDLYVRAKFRGLIDQVDPALGMIVHRSHWVAFGAVKSVDISRQSPCVRLITGTEAPISKAHRAKVAAHFGFDLS